MSTIGLGPECEFPRLIFAELCIGEEDLEELDDNKGKSATVIKRSGLAYFPHTLRCLHRRLGGDIAVREPNADGLIKIQPAYGINKMHGENTDDKAHTCWRRGSTTEDST